jgi:biopolymer transport protein ExbB/TolQ
VPNIKTIAIIGILLMVMTSNIIDFIYEFIRGESLWHLIEEGIVISMAIGLIIYLLISFRRKREELQQLMQELKTTEDSLEKSTALIQSARKKYSAVIHRQFDDWQLRSKSTTNCVTVIKRTQF